MTGIGIILYAIFKESNMQVMTRLKLATFSLLCTYAVSVFIASIVHPIIMRNVYFNDKTRHNTYVKFKTGKIIDYQQQEYVIGTSQNGVITFNDSILLPAAYPMTDVEFILPGDLPKGFETSVKQKGEQLFLGKKNDCG